MTNPDEVQTLIDFMAGKISFTDKVKAAANTDAMIALGYQVNAADRVVGEPALLDQLAWQRACHLSCILSDVAPDQALAIRNEIRSLG